jgi:hypothetical protein
MAAHHQVQENGPAKNAGPLSFQSLFLSRLLFVDVHDDGALGAPAAILIGYDADYDGTRASGTGRRTIGSTEVLTRESGRTLTIVG